MHRVVLCATLLAVVVPSRAVAQALTLTESQALTRLSPDSPRVRAIRAPIELARADLLAAGRWPNPRLTFDRESVAGVTENMLMVTQPLPITGRRGLDVQAAEAMVAASSSRVDDEFRRLRADLRLAFAELLAAQARVRELTASRDRLRGLAEVLAKREAAGDAAGFDRLRVEREGLDSDADRAVAAIDRARAQGTLAGFFADVPDPSGLVATSSSTAVSIAIPSVE
jgi:cobalt-zinc-cadmium efflux system outer membrane protein